MVCKTRHKHSTTIFMSALLVISTLEGAKGSFLVFNRITGHRYTSELGSQPALFEEQCLHACRNISDCSTVSYSKKYQNCLLGTTWINTDDIIETTDYYIFYRNGIFCRTQFSPNILSPFIFLIGNTCNSYPAETESD